MIGHRCKCSNTFSQVILINRQFFTISVRSAEQSGYVLEFSIENFLFDVYVVGDPSDLGTPMSDFIGLKPFRTYKVKQISRDNTCVF